MALCAAEQGCVGERKDLVLGLKSETFHVIELSDTRSAGMFCHQAARLESVPDSNRMLTAAEHTERAEFTYVPQDPS